MLKTAIELMERGYVPDWLARTGIRRLLAERLRAEDAQDARARDAALEQLIAELRASPIALHTTAANEQHYELPAGFFRQVAGATAQIQFVLVAGRGRATWKLPRPPCWR